MGLQEFVRRKGSWNGPVVCQICRRRTGARLLATRVPGENNSNLLAGSSTVGGQLGAGFLREMSSATARRTLRSA